tara:strand:- start:84775 stop:85398 length:624 start_codon:yes stop_codon:yes gene_type:complete
MGLKILPFRQYDDHDVVNLYRVADGMVLDSTTGAGSGDAGTFVKVSAGDFSADPVAYSADSYLGKTDYPFVGRNQYPKVSLEVEPVGTGDSSLLGITLLQTAKNDENGEKLLYNPQKAAELQAALPGQAVPIATKGIFTISASAFQGALGGNTTIGNGIKPAAGGTVTGCATTDSACFGTIIGTGSRTSQNGVTDQFAGEYLVFKFN